MSDHAVAPSLPTASSAQAVSAPAEQPPAKKVRWVQSIPFWLCHVAVLGAIWSGVTWQAVVLCVALLVVRTWGVTAGYHRYFSHRAFKTSRVFQFFLAFLAQTSAQKGALWWAAHHRVHHKLSDQPGDVHSPVLEGFVYSHVGWLFDDTTETRWEKIRDFEKYPELRLLNRFALTPAILLAVACWAIAGWPGLFIGFFLSTVLLWHNTFMVNSLAHVLGKRRFDTSDESRNNWFIGLTTLGEGWHNNHHHYQVAARQGFRWWEIDVTYYVLRGLAAIGVVWDLHGVPDHIRDAAPAAPDLAAPPPALASPE